MKFPEKCDFHLTMPMIISLITLQDLVQSFKKEGPEAMERTKVANELGGVDSKVMVRTNDVGAV